MISLAPFLCVVLINQKTDGGLELSPRGGAGADGAQ